MIIRCLSKWHESKAVHDPIRNIDHFRVLCLLKEPVARSSHEQARGMPRYFAYSKQKAKRKKDDARISNKKKAEIYAPYAGVIDLAANSST